MPIPLIYIRMHIELHHLRVFTFPALIYRLILDKYNNVRPSQTFIRHREAAIVSQASQSIRLNQE